MGAVCVEFLLDLHCTIQQILLCVPESVTFQGAVHEGVASKLASGDYLEESLTVSVSPT